MEILAIFAIITPLTFGEQLSALLHLGRVHVVQTEALCVGNHVRQDQFGPAPLPPAIFKERSR